jgi:hypothetical protein
MTYEAWRKTKKRSVVKFPSKVKERSNEGAKKPHSNVEGQPFFAKKCMMLAPGSVLSFFFEDELDEASADDEASDARSSSPLIEGAEGSEETDFEAPAPVNFSSVPVKLEAAAALES